MRPILGITNYELAPLFDLLRGDCGIKSSKTLIFEAQRALEKVTEALKKREAHCCAPEKPFFLIVLGEKMQLYGLIFQWNSSGKEPFVNNRVNFSSLQVSKNSLYHYGDDSSNYN